MSQSQRLSLCVGRRISNQLDNIFVFALVWMWYKLHHNHLYPSIPLSVCCLQKRAYPKRHHKRNKRMIGSTKRCDFIWFGKNVVRLCGNEWGCFLPPFACNIINNKTKTDFFFHTLLPFMYCMRSNWVSAYPQNNAWKEHIMQRCIGRKVGSAKWVWKWTKWKYCFVSKNEYRVYRHYQ